MTEKIKKLSSLLCESQHKCLILLLVFLFWLMLGPETFDTAWGALILPLYIFFLTIGPYVITKNRHLLALSLMLGIAAYILRVCYHSGIQRELATDAALLFFDLIMMISLVYYSTVVGKYTRDSIFGSIFAFMMIGVCFADFYYILQGQQIVGFAVNGKTTALNLDDCLYFSFTSLTTMGYGDIMPHTPLTKRMSYLEGVISIMYSAVFIGRLLAVYNSRKAKAA